MAALERVPLIGRLATPRVPEPAGLALVHDAAGAFAATCQMAPGSAFLVRPDGYLAGTARPFDRAALSAGLAAVDGAPG